MKNNTIRLSILALLLCAGAALNACGTEPVSSVPAQTGNVQEDVTSPETEAVSETEEVFRGVSEADFGGKTFTIYSEGWYDYDPLAVDDIAVEDVTGDSLNDAVYNRNLEIETAFHCQVGHAGFSDHENAFRQFTKIITAGDAQYDIALFRAANYLSALTGGYLVDLNTVDSLDFSGSWWDTEYQKALTLGGHSYAAVSDITMNDEKAVFCVYYNKSLIEDFDLENPNSLVLSGKWTYDTLFSMGRAAAADLNGDDVRNENDRYGVSHINDTAFGIFASTGMTIAEKDSADLPVFTFDREECFTKYLKLFSVLFDRELCYNYHVLNGFPSETDIFTSDQTLFCLGGIYYAPSMRIMKNDFGIIPFPKYEEAQSEYLSSAAPHFVTLCGIPVTNEALTETGIFMDYYAYLGHTEIRPEFYDVLLGGKVARDEESVQMLDMIFAHLTLDPGALFNFGGFAWDVMLKTNTYKESDIASFTEKYKSRVEADIQKLSESVS